MSVTQAANLRTTLNATHARKLAACVTKTMDFKAAPIKPTIALADLEKIDIRVGTIISVEDISGSDKLVKLVVDFGDHRRNILAGIK